MFAFLSKLPLVGRAAQALGFGFPMLVCAGRACAPSASLRGI